MFDLGIQELIVIFIVALLVFGPKKLPELGRTLGKGMAELRKALEGVREQIHTESEALSKPVDTIKEQIRQETDAITTPPENLPEGEKKEAANAESPVSPGSSESTYVSVEGKEEGETGKAGGGTEEKPDDQRKGDKSDGR